MGGQFVKGDPRINRKGPPMSFMTMRKLIQEIGAEKVLEKGVERTRIECLVRRWFRSRNPNTQKTLVEYGFGKVPDRLETDGLPDRVTLVLHYDHERKADARELPGDAPERLTTGDDAAAA